MIRAALAARPLQTLKFAVALAVLVFGGLGLFGVLPHQQLTALLWFPVVAVALALVVVGETLVAGYRAVRSDDPLAVQSVVRPAYTLVRAVEAAAAVLTLAGIAGAIAMVPDGPMAGPGAIGLLFIVVAFGLPAVVGVLVRTTVEFYSEFVSGGGPAGDAASN
ncbi:hypothetical protein [Halobellus sp. GM3]|uniref:hypothetical protein n=1 Tax=Halobellus sp. GM3 TaxID=3458410 RepID=UPI00403DA9E8